MAGSRRQQGPARRSTAGQAAQEGGGGQSQGFPRAKASGRSVWESGGEGKIPHEESERRFAAGNVYIFGLNERYAIDGDTPKNTARFINHSCEPNCHTEQFGHTIWIVAIKDIRAGEELTYNYGYEIDDEPAAGTRG